MGWMYVAGDADAPLSFSAGTSRFGAISGAWPRFFSSIGASSDGGTLGLVAARLESSAPVRNREGTCTPPRARPVLDGPAPPGSPPAPAGGAPRGFRSSAECVYLASTSAASPPDSSASPASCLALPTSAGEPSPTAGESEAVASGLPLVVLGPPEAPGRAAVPSDMAPLSAASAISVSSAAAPAPPESSEASHSSSACDVSPPLVARPLPALRRLACGSAGRKRPLRRFLPAAPPPPPVPAEGVPAAADAGRAAEVKLWR
mmetsp:Transcript_20130/g.60760  ORF Transcript_20130/g.60760 Transcript_20130/m.60760 type:complete len:261 (-) Transcript_20130:478-1260(-)